MPTPKIIPLLLQPKQIEIGELVYKTGPNAATWIGGGGARAGGKSGGLRRIMLDRRQQRPGTPGVILRRIYKDVNENHIQKYFAEFPELIPYWRATDQEFRLPNKSRLCFRYAENQQAVDQSFWGPEWYDIFVDQAEQFTERELTIIKSANRWPGAPVNDCKTALFFNPGGIGTEFLRRVFHQKRFNANERPRDFAFVHLFGWDNYVWFDPLGISAQDFYSLPDGMKASESCPYGHDGKAPDYRCCRFHLFIHCTAEGRKLDTMPPSLRAGHLLGSFDSFAGQYFAGVWDESKLILTAAQEQQLIQPWWTRWMAHDDGFVHHASIGWFVSGKVSPKLFKDVFGVEIKDAVTVVIVYRALTEAEVEPGELIRHARKLTSLDEARTMARYFLSVDAWEKDSKGHSVAEEIQRELSRVQKVPYKGRELEVTFPYPEQADNARIGGWRYLYAMMKKTADVLGGCMNPTRQNEDFDSEGGGYSLNTPLLFVSGECQDVIEAVPLAIRDDQHPGRHEDILKLPTKADDVNDMLRYGCKSMLNPRAVAPFPVRAQEKWAEMGDADLTVKAIQMRKMEYAEKRKATGRRSAWAR
jgi:hypothetical protein